MQLIDKIKVYMSKDGFNVNVALQSADYVRDQLEILGLQVTISKGSDDDIDKVVNVVGEFRGEVKAFCKA